MTEGSGPRVLSQGEGGAAGGVVLDPPPPVPPAADSSQADDPPPAEAEEAEPPQAAGRGELDLDELKRVWPAVLDKLGETAPALAATFEGACPVGLDDEGLKVGFPADKTFNKRKAEGPERRDALVAAFEAVTGEALRPTYVLLDGDAEAPDAPAPETEDEGIDEDALVEKLKSEFDAEEVG